MNLQPLKPEIQKIANNPGKGLYSGEFYNKIMEESPLRKALNPLQANSLIRETAQKFKTEFEADKIKGLKNLFEVFKTGGEYGINFDFRKERPSGCLSAYEVVERKECCCLEQTFLFLSIANQAFINQERTTAVGFLVYGLEDSAPTMHACGGILAENIPKELRYWRFEADAEFRKTVLETAEVQDEKSLNLILIDLTGKIFGAQHEAVVPMSNNEVLASYINTVGVNQKDNLESVACFLYSARFGQKLALHNLFETYSKLGDWKKIIELNEVPEDFIFARTAALKALAYYNLYKKISSGSVRSIEEMAKVIALTKIYALKSIQIDRDSWEGYYFLALANRAERNHERASKAFERVYSLMKDELETDLLDLENKGKKSVEDFKPFINLAVKAYGVIEAWITNGLMSNNPTDIINAINAEIEANSFFIRSGAKQKRKGGIVGLSDVLVSGKRLSESLLGTKEAITLCFTYLNDGQSDRLSEFVNSMNNKYDVSSDYILGRTFSGFNKNYKSANYYLRFILNNQKKPKEFFEDLDILDLKIKKKNISFKIIDAHFYFKTMKRKSKIPLPHITSDSKEFKSVFGRNAEVYFFYTKNKSSEHMKDLFFEALNLENSRAYMKAINAYTRIIELEPDNPLAYLGRTSSQLGAKDFQTPLDLQTAMDLMPDDPFPDIINGILLESMDDINNAIVNYENALARAPQNIYAQKALKRLKNDSAPANQI